LAPQILGTNASGRNLKAIMADFRTAFVVLQFLFAIEQLNRAYEYIEEEDMWVQIKKMVIGNNLVRFYEAACA